MKATPDMVRRYRRVFVNRLAFTRQSDWADPESGRHCYYLPKRKNTGERISLTATTIRRHLEGEITIGLYAINPGNQCCKWIAFDADYEGAMSDLRRLQLALQKDEVASALEFSRRGGHLWILAEKPLPARDCRVYAYNFVLKLGMRIKAPRNSDAAPEKCRQEIEGIEIFPKQDEVAPGRFGSAMRGPLGIHRGAKKRFWFEGAAWTVASQLAYLERLPKLREEQLGTLIAGKRMPAEFAPRLAVAVAHHRLLNGGNVFRILDHVGSVRRLGAEHVTQCPSCAADGHDRHRDNLHISVSDPLKYCCRAGCSADMIRAALGRPRRRSA
jgi:hypothetical protein